MSNAVGTGPRRGPVGDLGARAGWAEVDITPPLGLPMGGRGPRFAPATSVLDPLMAQALLLEDAQGNRQLWVSLDLIGLDHGRSAALRQDLSALTGAPYEAVVLNFAHIHSGPMTNFRKYPEIIPEPPALCDYQRALSQAVHSAVEMALNRMQPVAVVRHLGTSDIGINRRRRNAAGETVLAPNPGGAYNRDLWVLDLRPRNRDAAQDRALVFSYGCHPVIVYGYSWDGISAGYPGATRRVLRSHLDDAVHCQFLQGLAGNVRPRILADLERGQFRKSTPDDVDAVAVELAGDVLDALGHPGDRVDLALQAAAGWVHPRRAADQVPQLAHWQEMAARDDELSRNVGSYWAARIGSGSALARVVPLQIGLLEIAPGQRIAWFNTEAVAEWLPALRTWLEDPSLTVWGYCQDVGTYLPTDALLPEGGYEVVDAPRSDPYGPMPLANGIDVTVRSGFERLTRLMG